MRAWCWSSACVCSFVWVLPFPTCTSACHTTVCFSWCADTVENVYFSLGVPFDVVVIAAPAAGSNVLREKATERMEPKHELSQLPFSEHRRHRCCNARSREPERTLTQLSLPEHRRHRRYYVGYRGRCAHGWPGGDGKREHWRCSEMVRTPKSVRQRALAADSVAARVSSVGSRCMMTGMPQGFGGLCPCKTFRITDGPGQRSHSRQPLSRQSPSRRRRDLAALFPTCPKGCSRACWIGCLLPEGD